MRKREACCNSIKKESASAEKSMSYLLPHVVSMKYHKGLRTRLNGKYMVTNKAS